jgi:antibiotic biosynthesis monooxygenase (ABM) superfamily enzyme
MRRTYSGLFDRAASALPNRERVGHRISISSQRTGSRSVPPRYKVFLLTWLAIYPLITVIFLLFGSCLSALPLLLRTLLLTGVLVFLMTYLVMPKLMQMFHEWLYLK